jgi:cell division protein FtsQ
MERSIAARAPAGSFDLLWRLFEALASLARSVFRTIFNHRRLRIAFLALLIALPLLAGGWLLLRNSSFVAVEHVQVRGVQGPQAQAIETALTGAASRMSTLDLHTGTLRAAVASFSVVRSIRVIPSFPHGLRIDVVEQPPVAALNVGGERTAVAADGVVLGPALLSGSLPTVSASAIAPPTGGRVREAALRGALTVLGDAPSPLVRQVKRAYTGPEGLTLQMQNGLLVYFGDASRPHAKWLSLARVLADPTSAGAAYVDERLPERPAAGFAGGVVPEATGTADGGEAGSVSDPTTAAELAAGLTAAVGGGSSSAPPTTATPTPTGTEAASGAVTPTETPAGAGAAAASSASSGTPSGTVAETPSATPISGG